MTLTTESRVRPPVGSTDSAARQVGPLKRVNLSTAGISRRDNARQGYWLEGFFFSDKEIAFNKKRRAGT